MSGKSPPTEHTPEKMKSNNSMVRKKKKTFQIITLGMLFVTFKAVMSMINRGDNQGL